MNVLMGNLKGFDWNRVRPSNLAVIVYNRFPCLESRTLSERIYNILKGIEGWFTCF